MLRTESRIPIAILRATVLWIDTLTIHVIVGSRNVHCDIVYNTPIDFK